MRKILVFENVTLDGFMAGPNGELDWAVRDDEVTEYSKEGHDSTDMFLFGRVTYDMMASFWPTPMGKSANPVFAEALNDAHKMVFSTTLKKADWQNTEVVGEISKEKIIKLKQLSGKNMMIFGSGSLVEQLTKLELIDEYQLMMNPVVLGKGIPLFKNISDRINLNLVQTRTFKSGLVLLRYQPVTS
jgi:dihydrofolate reductase